MTTTTQLDLEASILTAAGIGLVADWEYWRARALQIPRREEARSLARVPARMVPVAAEDVARVRAATGVQGRAPQAWPGEHYDEGEEESDE